MLFLSVVNIDDCQPNPCKNGGSCTDKVNGYECKCEPGWSGDQCQCRATYLALTLTRFDLNCNV